MFSYKIWKNWVAKSIGLLGCAVQYACITHCTFEYIGDFVLCTGPSMEPTIHSHNIILTEHITPRFHRFERGDIVIAKSPTNPRQNICKRVTALPGDRVKGLFGNVAVAIAASETTDVVMAPILERQPESLDLKSLSEELPQFQRGQGDTPSPRTPSTHGSPSPPPIHIPAESTALVPILTEDGIPYDHTLPQYLRQVAGEPALEDIYNMTLRVLTETSSLQQMSVYTPNLRELNLEGSALSSLRDIGSELRFLQILRIGRCRLAHLDGTLGLTSLRELYAPGNFIASAAPCAHLSKLRILDLSRNRIQDIRTLGFLSSCKQLKHVSLDGNSVSTNPELANFLETSIPTLQFIDGAPLKPEDSPNSASRISSASSSHSSQTTAQPSTSLSTPVSKLTSGQILCGNIAVQRRRSSTMRESENTTNDAIEASRQWRTAYYRFRETNDLEYTDEMNSNHQLEENENSDSSD